MSSRKEIFVKLNNTKKLPSPSGTTLRVIQLCHDEKASINDIADIIQMDPALSAALLKYANAFFLTTGKQVVSVHKAAVKLGLRTVVNLALGLSLLTDNRKGKCTAFDYERFWSISLLQAIAAKNFAAVGKEFDPEEIFVTALLSNMGQLAFAAIFPEEYNAILIETPSRTSAESERKTKNGALAEVPAHQLRKELEKERFEIDSSELTAELFLDWGLPGHYALAAGFHEYPECIELGKGKTLEIAKLLHLAHQLADICLQIPIAKEQLCLLEETAQQLDVIDEQFSSIFDNIIAQWQESGDVLEIKTHQCLLYDDVMAQDRETNQ